eukprot:2250998-Pyramimonas_sp.AAC.1
MESVCAAPQKLPNNPEAVDSSNTTTRESISSPGNVRVRRGTCFVSSGGLLRTPWVPCWGHV